MTHNIGICTVNNIEILPQQIQRNIINTLQLINTSYSKSSGSKSINIAIHFCKNVSDYKRDLSIQTHREASIKTTITKCSMNFTIRVSTKNPYGVMLLTLREIGKALFIYSNLPMRAFGNKIKEAEKLAYQLLTETYASYYALSTETYASYYVLSTSSKDSIRHLREISFRSIKKSLYGYLVQGSSEDKIETTLLDRTKDILISCCNYVAASKRLGENPLEPFTNCEGIGDILATLISTLNTFLDYTNQPTQTNYVAQFKDSTQNICQSILIWIDTVKKNQSTQWDSIIKR